MKILHLVTQDYGGAGRAAYRIFTGIRDLGHDVKMLVLNKNSNDPDVRVLYEYTVDGGFTNSPDRQYISPRFQGVWKEWIDLMSSYPNRPQGLEIFTDTRSFTKFANSPEVLEADILNFHWMAGFINFDEIRKLLPDKPIVWTLHDMNPFTGGCHYAGDCLKYTDSCGACPQLGNTMENDISRKIWDIKENAYSNLNINVLTPSKWLGDCAKKSSLFGRFPVHVIANGFPLDKYFPKNRESLRNNLNIPLDQKVILFGADNLLNERKGLKYFLHSLARIVAQRNDIALAFFGHFREDFKVPFDVPIYQFGSVADEMKLSAIYSLADVFVIPSLEDNLPNTVVESMASGTPVVGFNIGGIPDMVETGITGRTAIPKDVDDLADAIVKVIDAPNYEQMRENCWEKAQREYSLPGQAQKYVDLYEQILSDKKIQPESKKEIPAININLGKTELPVISLVTPVYNGEEYLEECIDSILSQNYPALEYVIMDGGSTDGSVEIIKKYENYLTYWKSGKDNGQYSAINEGFKHTSGEIMSWLNSDDIMYPRTLHLAGSLFSKNRNIDWLTGRASIIRNNMVSLLDFKRWSRTDLFLENNGYIQQEGTFWRRKLWELTGGQVSEQYQLASDYELWVRFFRHALLYSVINLNAGFRKHEGQKSGQYVENYKDEVRKIIKTESESNFTPDFNPEAPPAIFMDESTLIPTVEESELGNLVDNLKSTFSEGNYKKAIGVNTRALYCDVNNSDLINILSNLFKVTENPVAEKVLLWNSLFAAPGKKSNYQKLIELEKKEKRLDNLAELIRLSEDYRIKINLKEEEKEQIKFYNNLLSNTQMIKLYLDNDDEQNASKHFGTLASLLGDMYGFEKDLEFSMTQVKEFANDVFSYTEYTDYESAIGRIARFFNLNMEFNI